MTRITEDASNLMIARVVAGRTTCARRAVGCVFVDVNGYIISTGRNGVPRGDLHCNEGHLCAAHDAPSGTQLSGCRAIHAEINALAHCRDPQAVDTIYLTASPCRFCCDALLALPNAKRLVAIEEYKNHPDAKIRWLAAGRGWEIMPLVEPHALTVDEIAAKLAEKYPKISALKKVEFRNVAEDLVGLFDLYARTP